VILIFVAACRQEATSGPLPPQPSGAAGTGRGASETIRRPTSPSAEAKAASSSSSAAVPLVVFLGDSLTAGYGLEAGEAFPALLEKRLGHEGMKIRAINAGVSGDTSAGGLRRLDWLLAQKPDVVLVELGANDGLRGLPLEQTEENLREIMASCRRAGATVVLAGMMIPTNYGPDYSRGFAKIYPKLARELSVPLVRFLLSGVAGRADLNQEDGIHPTAKGDEIVADNVLPFLRGALTERGKVGARGHSTKR